MVVGTDCDTGKMTTAWELYTLLKKEEIRVQFLATGQTGMLKLFLVAQMMFGWTSGKYRSSLSRIAHVKFSIFSRKPGCHS